MAQPVVDTLHYVRRLKNAGVPDAQVEEEAFAVAGAHRPGHRGRLRTGGR